MVGLPDRMTVRRALGLSIFVLVLGCGGGGGSKSSSPTAKTKSDVGSHLFAYGQSIVSTSFAAYGPKFQNHGLPYYDIPLGLWAQIRLGSSNFQENLFVDQGETTPAGNLFYQTHDATMSQNGTITISAGRFNGLTGTLNQTLTGGGYNGTISYTMPNVATVACQFALVSDGNGGAFGTGTNAIALQSGYTQNEKIQYKDGGTLVMTTTDSLGCSSAFNFTPNTSGSGRITGSDPGLPASLKWDTSGSGTITYADGSTGTFTSYQLSN